MTTFHPTAKNLTLAIALLLAVLIQAVGAQAAPNPSDPHGIESITVQPVPEVTLAAPVDPKFFSGSLVGCFNNGEMKAHLTNAYGQDVTFSIHLDGEFIDSMPAPPGSHHYLLVPENSVGTLTWKANATTIEERDVVIDCLQHDVSYSITVDCDIREAIVEFTNIGDDEAIVGMTDVDDPGNTSETLVAAGGSEISRFPFGSGVETMNLQYYDWSPEFGNQTGAIETVSCPIVEPPAQNPVEPPQQSPVPADPAVDNVVENPAPAPTPVDENPRPVEVTEEPVSSKFELTVPSEAITQDLGASTRRSGSTRTAVAALSVGSILGGAWLVIRQMGS